MDTLYRDRLEKLKSNYSLRLGAKQQLEFRRNQANSKLLAHKKKLEDNTKTSALLQEVSKSAREKAKTHLETVVTTALQYISGSDYKFVIELTEKAGKPFAEFYVETKLGNGIISKQRPQDACGGGFVDIICNALRFAYIELFRDPYVKGPILLDEPGKMVSETASVKFAEFIKQLGEDFSRQVLVVTHNENIESIADDTHYIMLDSCGISHVSEKGEVDLDSN